MRTKVDYRSAGRAAYLSFCKNYPEAKVSYNEWLEIIYLFNEGFRNHILDNGTREKLPLGFGSFSVNKKKRRTKIVTPNGTQFINLPVDWKKTQEKGKLIYNFNYHTEGYFFGWMWFKKEARFKHAMLWRFKPSRATSRMLGHYLKTYSDSQHRYKQWKN